MLQIDFLGAEFLTWVYFNLDELNLGNQMTLKPIFGDAEKVSIKSPKLDDSAEMLQAIKTGYYIDSLSLEVEIGDRVIGFVLGALDGSISSVTIKNPEKLDKNEEGIEADILIRMSNLDEIEERVDRLFKRFLKRRLEPNFVSSELQLIRQSVLEGLRAKII